MLINVQTDLQWHAEKNPRHIVFKGSNNCDLNWIDEWIIFRSEGRIFQRMPPIYVTNL